MIYIIRAVAWQVGLIRHLYIAITPPRIVRFRQSW